MLLESLFGVVVGDVRYTIETMTFVDAAQSERRYGLSQEERNI